MVGFHDWMCIFLMGHFSQIKVSDKDPYWMPFLVEKMIAWNPAASKYFEFVEKCRQSGIQVPIIPGLKIIQSVKQLNSLPKNFYIDLPEILVDELQKNPERIAEIGKEWAVQQMQELLDAGVPSLHVYVLNDAKPTIDVIRKLRR